MKIQIFSHIYTYIKIQQKLFTFQIGNILTCINNQQKDFYEP